MAAKTYEYALTGARGLSRVLYFEGLDFSIIIAPTIHGKPLLTTQAFYYLEQLESVVKIRFAIENISKIPEHRSRQELERKFEYIIDNYLFAFSKKYPALEVTSKITDLKYWQDGYTYHGYDQNLTQSLALDTLNDPAVLDVKNEDFPNKDHWYDWNLISNYTDSYIEKYISSMKDVVRKNVAIEVDGHEELGSGKFHLPLLRPSKGLLNYHQACMLETIAIYKLSLQSNKVLVSRGMESPDNFHLPVETFRVEKLYDSDLLSYYFAGVREQLPISKFRCFYNVLEYLFEEAPIQLGERARNEREQISCVVRWVATDELLKNFICNDVGAGYQEAIQRDLTSNSGVNVTSLTLSSDNFAHEVAHWLYDIRCACMHSKKTYRGTESARFVPYSDDEDLVELAIPIIQKISILCIEKDGDLTP
jgi:hypothetical protein